MAPTNLKVSTRRGPRRRRRQATVAGGPGESAAATVTPLRAAVGPGFKPEFTTDFPSQIT